MPNIKAAVKWVRQSEKRTLRNLDTKTRLKTFFKKAKAANAPAVSSSVEAQFDKAAATKSYQQLLDLWKNADADFIPLQQAKREFAGPAAPAK